jgi:hypothetical protein
MQKLELKSIYIFCRNCSSSYTEHNKIGFAIFGFFYDFILNLQITGSRGKSWKNLLALGPLELSKPYKQTLDFCTQPLEDNSPSESYPPAAEQARRRRGRAGGGKQVRGMSDWTHVWPIRGGGSSGEGSGDGRRRNSGSTAATARVPGKAGDARPSSAIGGSRVG